MSTVAQAIEAPARVLLVDDEPYNLKLLQTMLAPEGYALRSATSGQQALDLITESFPDLILRRHDARHGRLSGGGKNKRRSRHPQDSHHHGHRAR